MEDAAKQTAFVELRFSPVWSYVSVVRTFLANFFSQSLMERRVADRISLAAHELLENAIKYSSSSETSVAVKIDYGQKRVVIGVTNPAAEESIRTLRRELKLVTAGDPMETYVRKIQEAQRTGEPPRLGLARIRYETQADLELAVEDGTVTVTASVSVEEEASHGVG